MTQDPSQPNTPAEPVHKTSNETLHAASTKSAKPAPIWPLIGKYRKRPRSTRPRTILLHILAYLLIIGGLGFIIYSANTQYRHTLQAKATIAAQSTHTTIQKHNQGTANVQNTAQAHIVATITTQANNNTTATATVGSVNATASAFSNLYSQVTTGTPVLNDPLTSNKGPGNWEGGTKATRTGCAYTSGAYHVSEAQQGNFQPCFAQAAKFGNMAYQVSLTFNKGNHAQGGLLLRANSSKNSYYFFRIGVDGSYAFDLYTSSRASTLTSGFSIAIQTGTSQSNQLAIIAKGNHFYLYANSQYIDNVSDNTLTTGSIGLAVVDASTPADALLSNVQVWKI